MIESSYYRTAKAAAGNALCLFRLGDSYELFDDDARVAARVLGLALTTRADVPMAGFMDHQLDAYLAKLLAAGYRMALCEPLENAPPHKAPAEIEGYGKQVQRKLLSGLDCLPNQLDLFETDGSP